MLGLGMVWSSEGGQGCLVLSHNVMPTGGGILCGATPG